MPDAEAALLALPGVGKYTAGAVRSIAFGQAVPALDTHLLRVLTRVFAVEGDGGPSARRSRIEAMAARLVPRGWPGDFNQALMDLGSTVCLPRRPRCGVCPLRVFCFAYQEGRVEPHDGPRRRTGPS
ncbi:MAG: hypothetical protein ACE5KY_05570 [Candidatus Tectimicrobiota bacterium]